MHLSPLLAVPTVIDSPISLSLPCLTYRFTGIRMFSTLSFFFHSRLVLDCTQFLPYQNLGKFYHLKFGSIKFKLF